MDFTIIVTLGPALQNPDTLKRINDLGNCIYRINGAHSTPETLPTTVQYIRSTLPRATVMLDLPGNKVRLKNLGGEMPISKGEPFMLLHSVLNYPDYHKHLNVGDMALTHDSSYTLEIKEISEEGITFVPQQSGTLLPNKGIHINGANETLPFLFEKDKQLMKVGAGASIDCLSLSFVRSAADIKEAKAFLAEIDSEPQLISKIETALSTENLGEILYEVDAINIDRGDLSADIGIMKLPAVQERIIDSALRVNKKVYLATQFLHNMQSKPVPLISEIVDLYRTVKTGVSGLQLSEETAVGKYPYECAKLVFDMYKQSFSSA